MNTYLMEQPASVFWPAHFLRLGLKVEYGNDFTLDLLYGGGWMQKSQRSQKRKVITPFILFYFETFPYLPACMSCTGSPT